MKVAEAEKTRTSMAGAGVGDAADRVDGSSIQWRTNVWFVGDSGYKTAKVPCPRSVLTPASQPLVLVNPNDL
jgi:hypothetical protein